MKIKKKTYQVNNKDKKYRLEVFVLDGIKVREKVKVRRSKFSN